MNNLASACHNCGARIEQYSRYCRNCGVPVHQNAQNGGPTGADLVQKTTRMERPEIRVPRWRLSKVEGVNIPDGFPLQAQARIGRDPHCDIHLPSTNVSRYHAQIEWSGTGFDISDLNSTNGTYVNRRLIKEPTRLKIGSSIQIGEYAFLVMKDAAQCGNCRETVRSDDRFCQFCGNPLVAQEFRPLPGITEHIHEEPFPETTPVPRVPQDTDGLSTPKFNVPLPAEVRQSAAASREKPPPPAVPARIPADAARAPAPPPKPPPPQTNTVPDSKTWTGPRRLRTCLFVGIAALSTLIVLGGIGYALFISGILPR